MTRQTLHHVCAGAVKGYLVGGRLFPRKRDLLAQIQQILHGTTLGTTVAAADLAFLLDVLAHHPDAQRKVGVGVAAMIVRLNPKYPTCRCFWIIRSDGSETDWSFMKCIYPVNTMQLVSGACRHAVRSQTQRFKTEQFAHFANQEGELRCPIEQRWIGPRDAHVDHVPPLTLERLVTDFLAQRSNVPEDVALSLPADGSIGKTLADPAFRRAWQEYHREHAQLRVVSRFANLSSIPRQHRAERALAARTEHML